MQNDFKKAMSYFATGVSVVTYNNLTTKDISGVTISSLASVSLNPLKILFCLGNLGNTSSDFDNIDDFVVNILSSKQKSLAYKFAGQDLKNTKEFLSQELTLPLINNCLASIICKKGNVYGEGDHDIIIGEVKNIILGDESLEPLIYFKSKIIDTINVNNYIEKL